MKRVSRIAGVALSLIRRSPRRPLRLGLLALQLLGACVIAVTWIAPELAKARECVALRQVAQSRLNLERNHGDALRAVAVQFEELQRDMATLGVLSVDDARTHSLARELADIAGLTLTQFVAMDTEGTYLVTFRGDFASVVMFASCMEVNLSPLRLRRFIARSLQSTGDHLELELLLQKSAPTPEVTPSCAARRR